MAASVAIAVVSEPPQPEPALHPVSRVLLFLSSAFQWIGTASLVAAVVARRAFGEDSPVFSACLVTVNARVILYVTLLVVGYCLEMAAGVGCRCRLNNRVLKQITTDWSWKRSCQALGASIRDNISIVLGTLACFLLVFVGAVDKVQSIGIALFDVGTLSFSALLCFIIIPNRALRLWKTKEDGSYVC
ncbi:hypothetical protein QOZ80_8AG0630820 [Eleusine coracana subsp. coracana]|nr:hypothetical protein QOZ80_8AG0630820 [Eleusine coracana subsp. coracana]